jgi:uncharacterized protein
MDKTRMKKEVKKDPIISNIKFAALCITHNCNLRCKYCYAGKKSPKTMSLETAKKSLKYLHDNSNGKCIVTFFGGEPLIDFELLKKIVNYSQEKYGEKIKFRLSTNGTLLTKKIISYLKSHQIYFVLSIDGNKNQNDLNRKSQKGIGSYYLIEKNIKSILEVNEYAIAVSVVNPATSTLFSEGVKHLWSLGFKYILQTLDYSAPWDKKDLKNLEKQYKSIANFYSELLIKGEKIYYSPFDERIKTRAQKPYEKGDICDLANTQIAIAPSGRIYPCVQFIEDDNDHSAIQAIGDVFSGFDPQKRLNTIKRNYRDKKSCKECPLEGRCATYCGCINFRCTGKIDQIPPIICEHERLLMPIVDRMANKLWKKNVILFKRKFYEKTFSISSYMEDCCLQKEKTHVENKTAKKV